MKRKLRSDLTISTRRSPNSRCAYCHGTGPDLDECFGCGALTHAECREIHGSCPTLGCRFVARDPKHRSGRFGLMLRIVARGMAWGLMPGLIFLPAIPFLSIVPTHDVLVASLLWAVFAAPFLARAVYLARRAWRLLEETPEPLLMTVKLEGDPEIDQRVAVFSSPSDPTGRAEMKIGMLYAPDWALGCQLGTQVLVYGARGTGPFVVGMPGWSSLAFLAPFTGVRMPVAPSEPRTDRREG